MQKELLNRKKQRLRSILKKYDNLMVAFSGGVDSTFLLATAREILKERLIAITVDSPVHPQSEKTAAVNMARHLGVRHIVFQSDQMSRSDFVANSKDRCYVCKKHLFSDLLGFAAEMGFKHIAHGANVDDFDDYRPGFKAAREMGIHAPLVDAGMNKEDIRHLSRDMNLATWNKPPMACLATRIPYETPLTLENLAMVESAETFILSLGFSCCRVRLHGKMARVELDPQDIAELIGPEIRKLLVAELKKIGFAHICVDLEGYVQGSMNR